MSVKIPSDVDMADRIIWGLTGRQVVVLGATTLLAYSGYLLLEGVLPLVVLAVLEMLIGALGTAVAFGRPDGVAAERLLLAGLHHIISARKRVPAPEGLPELPAWARTQERVEPIALPVSAVDSAGVLHLGRRGCALVCRASALNFALRSPAEQHALVEGLGRFLNSLDASMSFVVRSERIDLADELDAMEDAAAGLPHPALETAARDHARFLASLAARPDILRREVYLVFFLPGHDADHAAPMLARRAEDAASLLSGLGLSVAPLDGDDAAQLLAKACDPDGPAPHAGQSLPDEVVRGAAQ